MNTYSVRTVKLAGIDPISHRPTAQEVETISITASDRREAYRKSFRESRLRFTGQDRQVFVDDTLELGSF